MTMTREEAIKLLHVEKSLIVEVDGNKGAEQMLQAYDMAIEALLADTVSRKDTVTLNSPISIQAEMVAVVRCKDCKHWQKTNIETIDGEPYYDCPFCGEWADANGFCSFGERREP